MPEREKIFPIHKNKEGRTIPKESIKLKNKNKNKDKR